MNDGWKRPAVWAAALGWINLIAFSWAVALRWLMVDGVVGLIWVLFFLFAVGAMAMGYEKGPEAEG